jgi:hypothetical protein
VPTPTPTPLHRALLVDETFDEDILRWNWKAQDGMDGIKDGKLWLHGPPDNPDRYDAFFVIPQVSVSVPGDMTIEAVFDRFPKFSGLWFRVSEGWFVIVLEEDGGTGLLRPALEEAGKAWDGLGQIRRASDGTVTLRLVFQGDKLQVWGNERTIATRTASIFAEPKQFGGLYIGEEAEFAADRLTFWTTAEIASQLQATPTPPRRTVPIYLAPFLPSPTPSAVVEDPGPLSDVPPPFEGYFLDDWKRSEQRSGSQKCYPGKVDHGLRHPIHPMSESSIFGLFVIYGRIQGFGRLEQESWYDGDEHTSTALWLKLNLGDLTPDDVWARVPLGGTGLWYLLPLPDHSMSPLAVPEPLGPNFPIEPEERRFDSRNLRLGDVIGTVVLDKAIVEKLQAGEIDRVYSNILIIVGGTEGSKGDILEGDRMRWP